MTARLRLVIDTNVLVSGIAYPASIPGRLLDAWLGGALEVALSHYILDEMARVLPRLPQTRRTSREIRELIDSLIFRAELIEPDAFEDAELRDAADQKILATFLTSKADYLITGDKDLLALAHRYSIVTPADFWKQHG